MYKSHSRLEIDGVSPMSQTSTRRARNTSPSSNSIKHSHFHRSFRNAALKLLTSSDLTRGTRLPIVFIVLLLPKKLNTAFLLLYFNQPIDVA
jgi:hypothetical protein